MAGRDTELCADGQDLNLHYQRRDAGGLPINLRQRGIDTTRVEGVEPSLTILEIAHSP